MIDRDPMECCGSKCKEECLEMVNIMKIRAGDVLTIAHIVQRRIRLRPILSTSIRLTQVKIKLVPAMTVPTATGFEKPTRAKRVEE